MTTKASPVLLKVGATSYTMSLDGLDMALLPIHKLSDKYSGNQQAAGSLDTHLKEAVYLKECDEEFCEFEVEAMKKTDPMKNCIFCHICQINVPKTHIIEHNDSNGHGAMLKMASKALDRINKHIMIIHEKKCHSSIKVQNVEQSFYYCATCNMLVDLSNTNHLNDAEHLSSLKREKLYVKIYEIYETLGDKESNNPIDKQLQDVAENTVLKETLESRGQNIKPANIEKPEPNEQSDLKYDKKSKSHKVPEIYCGVCDTYVPNTENNLEEHYNGKRHKINIVRNENHEIETASETSSADVVVTESDAAMRNSHSVDTASARRNDATVRSIRSNKDDEAGDKAVNILKDFVNSPVSLLPRENVKLNESDNACKDVGEEEAKTLELYKQFRVILKRLNPQTFDTLIEELKHLEINNKERLEGVVDLVFEKAVEEHNFSETCANVCNKLFKLRVPADDTTSPNACVYLKGVIISKCQVEFERIIKRANQNQEDFTGDTSMFRPAGRLTSTFAFSIDISPQDDDTQVTADEDDDDKAAAEEYLGNNIKTFPSTCQAEDLDAQLEETDAHTHIHIPNSTGIESTRDCVVVLCSDEQCSECSNSLRLLKHNNMQTHSAVKANLLRNKNMLNVEKHRLKQFKNVPALNINKRTDASEKPFQCEVCSKSFNVFSHLNQHKRIHTGEKPFQCVVCRKSFSRRAYLKSHIRSHTGERPFQCDVCSKSFSVSCNLNKHKRIHTGEKPFQCEVCWRSFSQRTALISHLRSHTGEKPFQCEVCNKPFSHKCDLVVHKRTHTGEKPFQCDVCNKSFSHRSHLIVHIRSHTARNRFNVR